jgi:hypothetical protein
MYHWRRNRTTGTHESQRASIHLWMQVSFIMYKYSMYHYILTFSYSRYCTVKGSAPDDKAVNNGIYFTKTDATIRTKDSLMLKDQNGEFVSVCLYIYILNAP